MYSKDILYALKMGKITIEEAKQQIMNLKEEKNYVSSDENMASCKSIIREKIEGNFQPDCLGNREFQNRYHVKWNYLTGSMFRAISSEELVISMAKNHLLSFFGSTGMSIETLEMHIKNIKEALGSGETFGACLIHNLHDVNMEWAQVRLYMKYEMPVIEAAAYPGLTLPIIYYRIKGLKCEDNHIVRPRRIIAKCSRLEIAKMFLTPPPMDMVEELYRMGLINEEEMRCSQKIPMADDIAVEGDSGGHTDQGVAFALIPTMIALRNELTSKYYYDEEVMIGYGGGIGTPEAVAAAFVLGADFIFTGSINQCTVEGGIPDVIKDILVKVSIHDTGVTVAGDMFELGAKTQVVKKYSQFYNRSNKLYSLFQQYGSIEEIPLQQRLDIEENYFRKTFEEVWMEVIEYKMNKHPEQIEEAKSNPRKKLAMIFKWYFNHCTKITLEGRMEERKNFSMYAGPAMGAFNQWVKGTPYEKWQNRRVAKICELLLINACYYLERTNVPVVNSNNENKIDDRQMGKEDIAIIGIAGEFPCAKSLEEYWNNISEGKNCISEVPSDRWSVEEYYSSDKKEQGKTYSKWMGVLEQAFQFDPLFFNISPMEAELMDPQQRMFLMACWHCIEDAGIAPTALSDTKCGVFVGCGANNYGQNQGEEGLNAQVMTGNSLSILSARISYILNLKGPCVALDTACSSSLVAISQACESLQLHTSDMCLAGGVYILPGPSMHIQTSQAGMLSDDERCYPFDQRAKGFVHGEGVGAVFLKRLEDAERDGDPIYGVIKGWGINQDGKTNGITAPSAQSQTNLERYVYDHFSIDPTKISYVEAHGTGTKLGDPIEFDALCDAFASYTDKKNFCALGSVKGNIGHLGKAAGVASVIKVLLAIKNKKLPPICNFETINEHIDIEQSPFYIAKKAKDWNVPAGELRMAAISSFGFSGTNAHIVIEEYRGQEEPAKESKKEVIMLSARTEKQLKRYAQKILEWVKKQKELRLNELAYTLMTGRTQMEYRLSFTADSIKEVETKLVAYIKGSEDIGINTGRVVAKTAIIESESNKLELDIWNRPDEVARLWTAGNDVEVNKLKENKNHLHRMHIPGYPFSETEYKIESSPKIHKSSKAEEKIHPLLHTKYSESGRQYFISTFTGKEKFFTDHRIQGDLILSGAAYIEMVQAALQEVLGLDRKNNYICLSNIVWPNKCIYEGTNIQLNVEFTQQEDRKLYFRVVKIESGEELLLCEGIASSRQQTMFEMEDLQEAINRCQMSTLSGAECYQYLEKIGAQFGALHQCIDTIYVGDREAVAKLRIKNEIRDSVSEYFANPGMLDGAFQTNIAFMTDESGALPQTITKEQKLVIPYAVHEVCLFNKFGEELWVHMRFCEKSRKGDKIEKYDLTICTPNGQVCAKIKEFSNITIDSKKAEQSEIGLLLLKPEWKLGKKVQTSKMYAKKLVFLGDNLHLNSADVDSAVEIIKLPQCKEAVDEWYQSCCRNIFERVKQLFLDKTSGNILIQVIVGMNGIANIVTGVTGLLNTIKIEKPNYTTKLIEIDESKEYMLSKLISENESDDVDRIRYVNGTKMVRNWIEVEPISSAVYKDNGKYVITGGMGKLGLLFAKDIAMKVAAPTIYIIRRSKKETDESAIKQLEEKGAKVVCSTFDITDKEAVKEYFASLQKDGVKINGIIHTAGIIRDNYIIKKNVDEFSAVLAPKVCGLLAIDEASKDFQLDFLMVCSSGAGVTGNAGQVDYSAANGFMDAYCVYRNQLVEKGLRHGKTRTINWPWWAEGGMTIDEETEKRIYHDLGMTAMGTEHGMQAFYISMELEDTQLMPIEGNRKRLQEIFLSEESEDRNEMKQPTGKVEGRDFSLKVEAYFRNIFAELTKIPDDEIEMDRDLEVYGIDSLMIIRLTSRLEEDFGPLSKTIFFEYQTLEQVCAYFIEEYASRLYELLDKNVEETNTAYVVETNSALEQEISDFTQPEKASGDIAIIGLAGRYPKACNIQEFWKNLSSGMDCITDIPKERWDYTKYYDAQKGKPGKMYCKSGGFIDGVDEFDPLLFQISPREAENMDPQERLFLECVYETFEDAGYTKEALKKVKKYDTEGNVGVYVGVMYEEYPLFGAQEQALGGDLALIGSPASIANRVSYYFNLHGPSMAVDTMCSSSLTTVHLACKSILNSECQMAIAGGVNISIHPNKYFLLSQGKFASEKGRCASFEEGGDGYVPGEGVGAILLKSLEDAVRDGDHIYGVIKGTAINHGGKVNGFTVPNPNAQADVLSTVYREANINPASISYIESHGTGTSLGDPIEITGMTKAFSKYTDKKQFCAIGSVKSNIGHLESAAGIAAITKVLLQLKNKKLVPSVVLTELNKNIDFEKTPFYVQRDLVDWKRKVEMEDGKEVEIPLRAGISSFGAGGANAHILIEEYIENKSDNTKYDQEYLCILSAKDEDRMKELVSRYISYLRSNEHETISLNDFCYTLQTGREAMEVRLAFTARTLAEIQEKLEKFADTGKIQNGLYANIKTYKAEIKKLQSAYNIEQLLEDDYKTRNYDSLMEYWVKGLPIEWTRLYEGQKTRKISLPTYPFEKSHYWAPGKNPLLQVPVETSSEKAIMFRKEWRAIDIEDQLRKAEKVLILMNEEVESLAEMLAQRLGDCVCVSVEYNNETLAWKEFSGCIDLTGCGYSENEVSGWLTLIQNFVDYGNRDGIRLLCVTRNLEKVFDERQNLSGALNAALYRGLQNEYKHVSSCHMDTDSTGAELIEQIIREFNYCENCAECCYRNNVRYEAVLVETAVCSPEEEKNWLSSDDVILITGGTRGLGYLCAQHMVKEYGVRKLVLLGREQLPPREQWSNYEHNDDSIGKKIRNARALELLGVEIKVVSESLSDRVAMERCMNQIQLEMGRVTGVIHCAGSVDRNNSAFIRKRLGDMEDVFEPKVKGLNTLYQVIDKENLKFMILFSSVSSLLPRLASGIMDYAMANAYMNYFAQAHSTEFPIMSIIWPNWKETGMGESKGSAYTETGLLKHSDATGLEFLDRILSSRESTVIMPACIDMKIFDQEMILKSKDNLIKERTVEPKRQSIKSENEVNIDTEHLKQQIREIICDELRMDTAKMDDDVEFQNYGMDSVLLSTVVQRIEKLAEGIHMDPSMVLENPTIDTLSIYMQSTFSSQLSVAYKEPDEIKEVDEVEAVSDMPKVEPFSQRSKIAIVGIGCHFPEATNPKEFWDNLKEKRDCMREIPKSRWDWRELYCGSEYVDGMSISKWGAFIDGIEDFDPAYFHISEELAPQIDPLQRQILEVSAEALADAGYGKERLWGKEVGVFVGARTGTFAEKLKKKTKEQIIGVGQNFIVSHLAHIYNLKGPTMVIDAACASALTAIHSAVRSIQNGECEAALAGGVDILLDETPYISLSASKILSPDGKCKTFDADANGIGVGEGCGVIILKKLEQAIQDKDKIYGVIDGSAINNDGQTMGVTTPNPQAQKELILKAIKDAKINPETITYVETHGTGTLIGDPIELKGLTDIFKQSTQKKGFCGVGSVKSNIGHLLSGAGMPSIIKVLLSIIHREIPATIHCEQPNPRFNFDDSPLYIVKELEEWKGAGKIHRAGISSFGLGGNNAHIIVSDEGIPDELRATTELRGQKVVFHKRRFWPQELEHTETNNVEVMGDFINFVEMNE